MTEQRATYSESREPVIPEPKHRYDWRRQRTSAESMKKFEDMAGPRHVAGLDVYGPYFTGDPAKHLKEEIGDEWHYADALERQRDAYQLALHDIRARIQEGGNQDAVILDVDRTALLALSQEFKA